MDFGTSNSCLRPSLKILAAKELKIHVDTEPECQEIRIMTTRKKVEGKLEDIEIGTMGYYLRDSNILSKSVWAQRM